MSPAFLPRATAAYLAACCCCLTAVPAGALYGASKGDVKVRPAGPGLELSELRGSAISRQLFARSSAEAAEAPDTKEELLEPKDNDTVTSDYWSRVDGALLNASKVVPVASAQDSPAPAPSEKEDQHEYVEVSFHPSSQGQEEKPAKQDDNPLSRFRRRLRSMHGDTSSLRSLNEQPIDMQLGARVMNEISRKSEGSPPPSQETVNEAFTAQCPMVMFGSGLYVGAPQCNSDLSTSMGAWQDPSKSRNVMRWQGNGAGGIRFMVDSKVSGDGSVPFAEIAETMSLNSYLFELTNCLGTASFHVEESIIRIDKFGRGATTATDHDLSASAEAFFYKYSIKNPSTGEAVAETSLYRADTHEVNITMVQEGSALEGSTVASAIRVGAWTGSTGSGCSEQPKGWNISFPTAATAFDTVATVQDLRVASAVVVTLMSFRDQAVGSDGLQHLGQANMFWSLMKTFFALLFSAIFIYIVWETCHQRGVDKKLRRIFFRLVAGPTGDRPDDEARVSSLVAGPSPISEPDDDAEAHDWLFIENMCEADWMEKVDLLSDDEADDYLSGASTSFGVSSLVAGPPATPSTTITSRARRSCELPPPPLTRPEPE